MQTDSAPVAGDGGEVTVTRRERCTAAMLGLVLVVLGARRGAPGAVNDGVELLEHALATALP